LFTRLYEGHEKIIYKYITYFINHRTKVNNTIIVEKYRNRSLPSVPAGTV